MQQHLYTSESYQEYTQGRFMVKQVKLGNLTLGNGLKPIFIAELGINHNGDFQQAVALTNAAINSGADIVKFQHHLPEYEMVGNHEWQGLMKQCALSLQDLKSLQTYIRGLGREFLCTPFCTQAAEELESIGVSGFKTGSGECNNTPFQEFVAQYKKPTLISTGMTSRNELMNTIDKVLKINNKIVLLNCTSTYPATPREARLRRIQWLRSTFNLPVGQSDHTPNISTALGAIAQGAVCIEKHFTLDRGWDGPDQSASILPSEFKQMVEMGMEIWEGMGMCIEADMGILRGEHKVREIANHSVVAMKSIKKGHFFDLKNIGTMRPGNGDIPASRCGELLGRSTTRDIDSGELICYEDLR